MARFQYLTSFHKLSIYLFYHLGRFTKSWLYGTGLLYCVGLIRMQMVFISQIIHIINTFSTDEITIIPTFDLPSTIADCLTVFITSPTLFSSTMVTTVCFIEYGILVVLPPLPYEIIYFSPFPIPFDS